MRTGLLRLRYWAIDPASGERAELLAEVLQRADGRYDRVYCTDGRAIDAVLEMFAGADRWVSVRSLRVPPGAPRTLPSSSEI